MQMLWSLLWAAIAFFAFANGVPSNLEGRADDAICLDVRAALGSRAVAICNDYLGQLLPETITVKKTTTHTIVKTNQLPVPTTRTTVSVTTTVVITSQFTTYSVNPTTTSITTLTQFTTTYRYQAPVKAKRDARGDSGSGSGSGLRYCEEKYGREVLRSACECIAKPKRETRTTTTRITTKTTRTVTKQPLSTKVVTSTITISTTSQVDVTTTLGPTSTVTVQSTSTTVAAEPVVRPAICGAQGSHKIGPYINMWEVGRSDCIDSCKSDINCLAAAHYTTIDSVTGLPRGHCWKFSQPVLVVAELGFGFLTMYDKDCPVTG